MPAKFGLDGAQVRVHVHVQLVRVHGMRNQRVIHAVDYQKWRFDLVKVLARRRNAIVFADGFVIKPLDGEGLPGWGGSDLGVFFKEERRGVIVVVKKSKE